MTQRYHARTLTWAFLVNTFLTVIEFVVGILTGSTAVLADGSQNLTDSLVISIAFICERLVGKPRIGKQRSLRIYRITGSLNAAILICLSYYVGFLAVSRIIYPQAPNSMVVIAIGILSILVNFSAAGILFESRRATAIQAPYIGLIFSGLSGIGVLLSGIASMVWHIRQIDGITGLAIASVLLMRAVALLWSALHLTKAMSR